MIFKKQAKDAADESAPPTEPLPPELLPLRERLSYAQAGPAREFGTRFAGRTWMYVVWPSSRSNPWPELPAANRFFLSVTGICIAWLALRLTVPPLYRAGAAAVYPYTAAGQQATCLDNLKAIHQAVALYAQDHGGGLPPLDIVEAGQRATWVSLLRPRAEARVFQCPKGPAVASYVLNPVLALHRLDEPEDPYRTLLLADGGEKHDVSLLPPFPGWPSFQARPAVSFDAAAANLGLRHWDGRATAGAVYADGHAEPLGGEARLAEAPAWGGSLALRASLRRLEDANPRSRGLVAKLRQSDVEAAGRYYAANRKVLQPVAAGMVDLWKLNSGEQTSDSVQAIGWNLARATEQAGDGTVRKQLDAETGRRMDAELDAANQAGFDVAHSDQDFDVRVPRNWTRQEETVGRYTRTYFRSASPDVFAVFETGQRVNYSPDQPVDWGGMVRDLRRRYGSKGYKLVRQGQRTFYYRTSSVWEYEVEKPGSPRLRKLYIGYVSGYGSHVAAFTAPAGDFEKWRPLFEEMLQSFSYQ